MTNELVMKKFVGRTDIATAPAMTDTDLNPIPNTNFIRSAVHPAMKLFEGNHGDLMPVTNAVKPFWTHDSSWPPTNSFQVVPEPPETTVNPVVSISGPMTISHQGSKWFVCQSNDCCEIQMVEKRFPTFKTFVNYCFWFTTVLVVAYLTVIVLERLGRPRR